MISDFIQAKTEQSSLPEFSFNDLQQLKLFLVHKFVKQADLSFHLILNNTKIEDPLLDAAIEALYDNQNIHTINNTNANQILYSLSCRLSHQKQPPHQNETEGQSSNVTLLNEWKNKRKPKSKNRIR